MEEIKTEFGMCQYFAMIQGKTREEFLRVWNTLNNALLPNYCAILNDCDCK